MIDLSIKKKLIITGGEMALDLNLQIAEGEFITLYGKSGAGKTTTLRMLAGLAAPDTGLIKVGDETWFDSSSGVNLPPQKRAIGFVFQEYALFPNMTVRQNLEYALNSQKDYYIIEELLETVGLQKLADRKPHTLSGGQQQRVALARALVRRPKILLLDEPLSALDSEMRSQLQDEILNLHRRFGATTILVSHDMAEIFKLSHRILVIDGGKIVKSGSLADVFIGKKLSGKFKFEGTILDLQKDEVVYIVTISIGNNIVKVIATDQEAQALRMGSQVVVSSKAFNPLLLPVK